MLDRSRFESQPFSERHSVLFNGTVALKEGQGLCYKRDYTSATELAADEIGYRDTQVELPDGTNNLWFAGVASRNYAADTSGLQRVEIFIPGSVCRVAIGADVTMATGIITCSAGAGDPGRFTYGGFAGKGSAIPLQTNASGNLFAEVSGSAVGTLDATGKIITAGAGDPSASVAVGDTVYGVARSATTVTRGAYTVSAVSATTITVSTAISSSGTPTINYYVVRGNPTCLAYLMDGEESGLQELLSPISGAVQSMVGGVTYIAGPYTPAGDATSTLANGTRFGELKAFHLLGTLTTNDYLVTVTGGEQLDGSTDLASMEFDAAGDVSMLVWGGLGGKWRLLTNTGTGLA